MSDKIIMEEGKFDWAPAGYSGRASPRPAEADLPEDIQRELDQEAEAARARAENEGAPTAPAGTQMLFTEEEMREIVATAVNTFAQAASEGIAQDNVLLESGTAKFLGHAIQLSSVASETIRRILAAEVCRQLTEEQQRVIDAVQWGTITPDAVQQNEMSGTAGAGTEAVPTMPRVQTQVDSGAPIAAGEV